MAGNTAVHGCPPSERYGNTNGIKNAQSIQSTERIQNIKITENARTVWKNQNAKNIENNDDFYE